MIELFAMTHRGLERVSAGEMACVKGLMHMTTVTLLAGPLVLAAYGYVPVTGSEKETPVYAEAETKEFVNEHILSENPLFIPPLLEPRIENGEKIFDLVIQEGETEFFPGKRTKTLGFNGDYLGPTLIYHPFHIHGVQFLVLDRNSVEPPLYEQGWKDTVMVLPGETMRVILQFKDYADPHLPYMFHCHILEHEDMGMIGQFVVVDDLSDEFTIQSPLVGPLEGHSDVH